MIIELHKTVPESLQHRCVVAEWAGMHVGDEGEPIELANFADRSVQVIGSFGTGGAVRIEGSLDGANYEPLTDPQGNTLDFLGSKIEAVIELVRYIRPRVLAGDGTTNITVVMLLKGAA